MAGCELLYKMGVLKFNSSIPNYPETAMSECDRSGQLDSLEHRKNEMRETSIGAVAF